MNPKVAKQIDKRFHKKYNVKHLLEKEPDYVVLTTRTKPIGYTFVPDYWVGETALYEHPTFKEKYKQWSKNWSYTFEGREEYLVVFEKQLLIKNEVR